MPDHKDISVVVQGPLAHGPDGKRDAAVTREVLRSVRKHLPDAELILSTWEGEDTQDLEYDHLVSSKDPGAIGERGHLFAANLVRQIVSTANGLSKGTCSHALKIRTDTRLTSNRFVSLWHERQNLGLQPKLFQTKLLVSAVSTPRPKNCARPYWVSDFIGFGKLCDLQNLWNPKLPSKGVAEYLPGVLLDAKEPISTNNLTQVLTPEQILVLNLLENNGVHTKLRTCSTVNPIEIYRSEKFIAAHFIPVDPPTSGFKLPAKFTSFTMGSVIYRDDLNDTIFTAKTPFHAHCAIVAKFPEMVVGAGRVGTRRLINVMNPR